MAGTIGPAKCSRCRNTHAIEIYDGIGWEVSCPRCGLMEIYDYGGERQDYRLECPIGVAHCTRKDQRGSGWHQERFFSAEEFEDALARLRNWLESGEVYPESVYLTRWNETKERLEFLIGSPECLDWKPPMRADVPQDPDGEVAKMCRKLLVRRLVGDTGEIGARKPVTAAVPVDESEVRK
jgi:hypothetical protein